jgi:hypothetical protein
VLAQEKPVLVDRQSVNRVTAGSPKYKQALPREYTPGVWSGHANVTRYGKFKALQNNAALDQAYDPQWVLGVSSSVHRRHPVFVVDAERRRGPRCNIYCSAQVSIARAFLICINLTDGNRCLTSR